MGSEAVRSKQGWQNCKFDFYPSKGFFFLPLSFFYNTHYCLLTENYNLRLANFLLRTKRDELVLMRDIKGLKLIKKERRSSEKKRAKEAEKEKDVG